MLFLATYVSSGASGKFQGLCFETKGRGEAIVFIHGGQLDRRMWDAQFDLFAKEYRVIRYDIRGFGKSEAPLKPYSDASDLASLLEHLRIKKATFIGLSLGAAVAVDTALVHPQAVHSLILVCPGLGGFRFEDKANDLRSIVEAAREENYEKAAELWLQNPYMAVATEDPALHARLRRLAKENVHCWLKNPLLLRNLKPPAVERLGEIRAPTLVIDGERDVSDIHKIVNKLAAEISGAQKKTVAGAGHLVPMEKAEEFNELALEFLGRQYGR